MTFPRVTIVNCGHGNLASVANAFRALGVAPFVTSCVEHVRTASCLVFPGQGVAPAAMSALHESGLGEAFVDAVHGGVPALGICLGMQLALDRTSEGATSCLGMVPGDSTRFESDAGLKIPQIGWNSVRHDGDPLFEGIETDSYFYFVHSYFCRPAEESCIGWTEYGREYCSALRSESFWATQFHPEKSGAVGLRLVANFLTLAARESHR